MHIVTWYPTGRREIKLLLLVFELTVSSRQKQWPLRKECGSHRGDQVLALSNLRSPDTGRGKREKPNDWLGPQNGSGAPFPSAEVKDKKYSFWAGFVASGRTIAILLRVDDKSITETRRTRVLQASIKNRTKSISPWKKKDSPVEPRREKDK